MKKLISKAKDPTHVVMGVKLDGDPYEITLSSGPHWLFAGQTGSGKSVFINAMLISAISHATPDELKMQWVDPKKVEAAAYVGLPYCDNDPITDMQDAYAYSCYLAWLMDERYEKFTKVGAKNISEFNEYIKKRPVDDLEPMPYFLFIVDEYADLMSTNPEVEENIKRLGAKARAAGIHCIIATQRPSVDVISSTLKSNVPARVGLKTADSTNSQIIIDEPGCESLRGYGDGLIKTSTGEITRVQGPYITNEEINAIFDYLRGKYERPEPIDYKSKVVELGLCEWVMDYTDDVPMSERHVKAKRRSRW